MEMSGEREYSTEAIVVAIWKAREDERIMSGVSMDPAGVGGSAVKVVRCWEVAGNWG